MGLIEVQQRSRNCTIPQQSGRSLERIGFPCSLASQDQSGDSADGSGASNGADAEGRRGVIGLQRSSNKKPKAQALPDDAECWMHLGRGAGRGGENDWV